MSNLELTIGKDNRTKDYIISQINDEGKKEILERLRSRKRTADLLVTRYRQRTYKKGNTIGTIDYFLLDHKVKRL